VVIENIIFVGDRVRVSNKLSLDGSVEHRRIVLGVTVINFVILFFFSPFFNFLNLLWDLRIKLVTELHPYNITSSQLVSIQNCFVSF